VASRSGLEIEVNSPPRQSPKQYVQWGETDWSFLCRLADDHGSWMRPSAGGGVEIQKEFQQGGTARFREEHELLSFRVSGRLGQPSFDGSHYDPAVMQSQVFREIRQEPAFTGASGPLVDAVKSQSGARLLPGYGIQRSRALTLNDYQRRLEHESKRVIGSTIVCHGISRIRSIRAGETIQIEGAIDAKGLYGVYKVIHRWRQSGYENEFWCTPWKDWINPDPPPARLWYGVVPARVAEHSDPENFGRIRIRFYWQEDGDPVLWARMMTPHAGSDRGFFFQPEVGDEVVVAFEDGDVERPVVLGSIWNGVDSAPVEEFWGGEYKANDVKRIVTKSGHRIQMIDKEGKESLTLATPRLLRIAMLEKADETGRSAIVLHSDDGDIILSAPNGRVHIHGKLVSSEVGGGGGAFSVGGAAAKPLPSPPRRMSAAAQRKALQNASRTGSPLCEVCH
jgi:uncharacterized protein involved in type VI secretion and phage assembly